MEATLVAEYQVSQGCAICYHYVIIKNKYMIELSLQNFLWIIFSFYFWYSNLQYITIYCTVKCILNSKFSILRNDYFQPIIINFSLLKNIPHRWNYHARSWSKYWPSGVLFWFELQLFGALSCYCQWKPLRLSVRKQTENVKRRTC